MTTYRAAFAKAQFGLRLTILERTLEQLGFDAIELHAEDSLATVADERARLRRICEYLAMLLEWLSDPKPPGRSPAAREEKSSVEKSLVPANSVTPTRGPIPCP